jgi:hypothetical protein
MTMKASKSSPVTPSDLAAQSRQRYGGSMVKLKASTASE